MRAQSCVKGRDVEALEIIGWLLVGWGLAELLAGKAPVTEPKRLPAPAFAECPKGHAARYRPEDRAVYCRVCDLAYYNDFAALVAAIPTKEAA